MDEGADPSPALRRAEDDRMVDAASDRVHGLGGCGRIAAQEGAEVPRRREPYAHDRRILGGVDKLVDVVGVEAALETDLARVGLAGERRILAVGEGPFAVRNCLALIVLVDPARERRTGVVEARAF